MLLKLRGVQCTPGQWKYSMIKDNNLLVTSSENPLLKNIMGLQPIQAH